MFVKASSKEIAMGNAADPMTSTTGTAQREGLGGGALAPPLFARIKIN